MTYVEKHIQIKGEQLVLNNLRAIYWETERALIVSDLHIGKTGHFRKHGIPIPSSVQKNDLNRLTVLIEAYNPKQIIVVGDLFHAEINADMKAFNAWRTHHADVEITLIKGNHDRQKNDLFERYKISCCTKMLELKPFVFVHEPTDDLNGFVISGHIHPGIRINSKRSPGIKLPCFQISESQLVLPAFSKFTGLDVSNTSKSYNYYAFTDTAFFEF